MEAHSMKEHAGTSNGGVQKTAGVPLTFDHKTECFMMARQVMQGNKSVSVMTPISNRGGTLQARGSSYGGGSSLGGGSRGGGGASISSGGGSHGGGGGTTASSSASTSTTTSTSAASSSPASSSAHH
jgi:hypothetical protein